MRDVHSAYVNAVKEFAGAYEAGREAALVIEHLTGLSRAQQSLRGSDAFEGDPARLEAILTARRTRQPLSQILGYAPFRDRLFRVTPDVLTPRADTETLLDAALAASPRSFLDLGTGPGTLALTVLAELPDAQGVASDTSRAALDIAAVNADALGVAARVTLIESDWFDDIEGTFDLIISNPPYVDAATYATLAPEITRWEPRIALSPGGDGLDAYRIIIAGAPAHLRPGGHLMVEIGFDQAAAVSALFKEAGFQDISVLADLNGKSRVVGGIWR
ncbi:peptide chain release factor N(5)-glutamine methyltransferase [Rhodobacteraceae bacterium N5(2021)]|uniref:Release factor glutamine methyltransferase n=1 Tax=Gymnodinialimonas phycosphaerae TaxID=2841589 RepID=A0A975YHZ9_9RHOB|nr:peptide chain release factor N(5)-glutamine methyltransferase [Gymnodinialimonas phycosphaerae]MBY4891603.1 peptide chain release factor N(5)-glutamine methyltransferase [Gymnodinialimonas phycosphaerae]